MRSKIGLQLRVHSSIKEHQYMEHHFLNQKLKSPNSKNFSKIQFIITLQHWKENWDNFCIHPLHILDWFDTKCINGETHLQSQYGSYKTGALQLKTLNQNTQMDYLW